MKEVHLHDHEKELTRLTFLRTIASSIFVVLLFVLLPLFALDAPNDFIKFFIPSDFLQTLSPSTKAIAAALCAAALFPWIVALALVWRRTIAGYATVISALLVLAQLAIIVAVLQELSFASTREIVNSIVRLSFALAGAAVSFAFAWYVFKDGRFINGRQQHLPAAETKPGSRDLGGIIQAAFGIDPETSRLPRWWQRLAARSLFLLSSIGRGLAIFLLILLLIPFRINSTAILIPEGTDLIGQQLGELAVPFGDILARTVNIAFYRVLLILPMILVLRAARHVTTVPVEVLLAEDKRPPILFLRSFYDDQVRLAWGSRGRLRDWIAFGEALPSLDHLLLYESIPWGPAVAIGKPGAPVPFGVARTYVSDDRWQSEIVRLAEAAAAIIIVVDDTSGVKWELDYVTTRHSAKTLYLIPPRLASPDDAIGLLNDRLFKPSSASGDRTSVPDSELTHSCVGWYMNSDGEPMLLTCDDATAAAYVVALRLYAISRRTEKLTVAASELEFKERHKAEQPSMSDVDTVFRTSRGMVVLLKDGSVMIQTSGECRTLGSAREYRELFNDDEQWTAIKAGRELRSFMQAHSGLFKPTT